MKKQWSILICLVMTGTQIFAGDLTLPVPRKTGGMPLMEALSARQTGRTFSEQTLSDQQLSDLLWAAFGINRDSGKRTAPSAMNRQEIDLYVALSSGLYLYDAKRNVLTQLLTEDIRGKAGRQPFVKTAPVCLIYVSDDERLKSEFYAATDTGFISQNVYLFCASEGLHTVVLGSIDKDALHNAMKLTPAQHVILTQPVGKPLDESSPSAVQAQLRDGTYAGEAAGYDSTVRVAVTVSENRISRIEVTKQSESRPRSAFKDIPARIISRQKPDVDAVSGATYSSRAVMRAVQNALEQAK